MIVYDDMHFKAENLRIPKHPRLLFLAQNLWMLRPPKTRYNFLWDTLYFLTLLSDCLTCISHNQLCKAWAWEVWKKMAKKVHNESWNSENQKKYREAEISINKMKYFRLWRYDKVWLLAFSLIALWVLLKYSLSALSHPKVILKSWSCPEVVLKSCWCHA